MPVHDAYAERKYQQVMEETWGHLRARPGTRYRVSFVFGRDLEGYSLLLAMDQPDDLDDSPWLHQDTRDKIEAELDRLDEKCGDHYKVRGTLWQFDGEYIVYKNRRRRFVGRVRRVKIRRPKRGPQ